MAIRISPYFSHLRKPFGIILLVISITDLFFIIFNAEAWLLCEKHNGVDAILLVMAIAIPGIIIGVAQWRNISKSDIFVIVWFIVFFFWIITSRLC